mmetsp:Transcript_25673/g.64542  ORF Transcript_25673/g.64542 Transcript_25673/m.64542 type:complete len:426 (-) Transcript_25673:278-1555(-)
MRVLFASAQPGQAGDNSLKRRRSVSESFNQRYHTSSQLAVGDSAEVREVVDQSSKQQYAAKLYRGLASPLDIESKEVGMLLTQAQLFSQLKYDSLLSLHAVYVEDDFVAFVVDLCKGGSVKEMLEKKAGASQREKFSEGESIASSSPRILGVSRGQGEEERWHSSSVQVQSPLGALHFSSPLSPSRPVEGSMDMNSPAPQLSPLRVLPPLNEREAAAVMADIFGGLIYLHRHGVIHQGVTLGNVLLRHGHDEVPSLEDNRYVLGGYGSAHRECSELPPYIRDANDEHLFHLAPEVLTKRREAMERQGEVDSAMGRELDGEGRSRLSPKCDMWSAGVVMYTLLSGEHPFRARTSEGVVESIVHARLQFDGERWDDVSNEAIALLSLLLRRDPSSRPTAEEALCCSDWMSGYARERAIRHCSALGLV